MCLALPLAATIATSLVGQGMSFIGQRQQAAQQQQYNNDVYRQQHQQALEQAEYNNRQVERQNQYIRANADNVQAALQLDREALMAQEREEGLAFANDLQQKRIERLKAVGALQASERSGISFDTLLQDFHRQEAIYRNNARQNLAFSSAQRQREGAKLTSVAKGRIAEARPYEAAPAQNPYLPQQVATPSALGALAGMAGSTISTLNSRSVYDPTRGRYVLDSTRVLPTAMPQTARTRQPRSFTTGLSMNKNYAGLK